MNEQCLPPEELIEIAEHPAEDPGRRHVEGCPRCQAILTTYREFLAAEGENDPDQLAGALDRLAAGLEAEIFGGAAPAAETPAQGKILQLRSPFVRSLLAVAAVALLFFAVDGLWEQPGTGESHLRSGGQTLDQVRLYLEEPAYPGGGDVELAWQPIAGADAYRVEVLNVELDALASFPVTAGYRLRLTAGRLAELLPTAGTVAWLVIGLSEGGEIARSELSTFVFRPGS